MIQSGAIEDVGATVLIVDDEPLSRMLLVEAVERHGFSAIEAESGPEALRTLQESKPDLVILDILMPDMDGFEVCRKIRENSATKHLPVLVITGLEDEPAIDHAFSVGATGFLTKPVNYAVLGHHVRYMLRSSRLEQKLREARSAAEASSRAKTRFLSVVSHELRTPLNAILGFSEMIGLDQDNALSANQIRDYSRHVFDSGRHLLDIVNNVLNYTSLENGENTLNDSRIDLAELMTELAASYQQRAALAGVSLSCEISGNLPILEADRTRLKQALEQLLSNAVKFTPPHGSIVLRAYSTGENVALEVVDTGIGMDVAEIGKAIEPLSQLDDSLSRTYEGLGLGLALVSRISEVLGGRLEMKSGLKEGTKAMIVLPTDGSLRNSVPPRVGAALSA